jgi:hypothetical protein
MGWPAGAYIIIDTALKDDAGHLMPQTLYVGNVTARPDGTFRTAPFPVNGNTCEAPESGSSAGPLLFVAHTVNDAASAQAVFNLTDPPFINFPGLPSESIPVGSQFTIQGGSAEPYATITLTTQAALAPSPGAVTLQAVPGGVMSTRADQHGAFSIYYVLPPSIRPRSTVQVSVQIAGPRYGTLSLPAWEFQVRPAVLPTVLLSHVTARPATR